MIGEIELKREARRVLRRLMGNGCALVRDEDGRFEVLRAGKPERPRLRVEQAFVAAFRARDWLAPRGTAPESFILSEPGAAWLRRTIADGDPFAAQHQIRERRQIIDADGIEQAVIVDAAESPLARMRARGLIDAAQYEAGDRLRRDYTLAQLAPRLGVDLSAPVVMGRRGAERAQLLSDTVIAAKQRFNRAMAELGPGLSDLLFDVCCQLTGLEDSERAFGWPTRTGKVVLGLALDRLALHYGFAITGPRAAKMRGWRME
jgi:uncharacterized protein DUF6456